MQEIERILVTEGIGTARDLAHAREISDSLGLFLRSLVGLDRAIAKSAFNQFLTGRTPNANQIEFLNMVIDHVAERGFLDPELLYASPFIDLSAKGVDGIFPPDQVSALLAVLQNVIRLQPSRLRRSPLWTGSSVPHKKRQSFQRRLRTPRRQFTIRRLAWT